MLSTSLYASTPVWTYSAPNPKKVTVSDGGAATVSYTVTNQSRKAKNLILKATPGLSASACHLAGKGSTCSLTISINGSLIPQQGIHTGPVLCEQGNPNQCYQPSAAHVLHVSKNTVNPTSLTVTPSELALSVTGLTEYGIPSGSSTASGRARQITITNTGASAATNVGYTPSHALPTGTTITPSSCGTIASSGKCVLTITPGSTPSAAAGDANPVPVALSISGNNTNTASTEIHVLTYGSVYQGGYVFAFDDTKGCTSPTEYDGSVGGKVVTVSDQADPFPNGIIWSSNGDGAVSANRSYDIIPGIAETSLPSLGVPAFNDLAAMFDFDNGGTTYTNTLSLNSSNFEECDGKSDGACNTRNILKFYDTYKTNYDYTNSPPYAADEEQTNRDFYAAGLCTQTIGGYNDWYLPAICEMGFDEGGTPSGCGAELAPLLQNIQSSLVGISGVDAPAGYYWSSTELAVIPHLHAWGQGFAASGSNQNVNTKFNQYGVRCVRGF